MEHRECMRVHEEAGKLQPRAKKRRACKACCLPFTLTIEPDKWLRQWVALHSEVPQPPQAAELNR